MGEDRPQTGKETLRRKVQVPVLPLSLGTRAQRTPAAGLPARASLATTLSMDPEDSVSYNGQHRTGAKHLFSSRIKQKMPTETRKGYPRREGTQGFRHKQDVMRYYQGDNMNNHANQGTGESRAGR